MTGVDGSSDSKSRAWPASRAKTAWDACRTWLPSRPSGSDRSLGIVCAGCRARAFSAIMQCPPPGACPEVGWTGCGPASAGQSPEASKLTWSPACRSPGSSVKRTVTGVVPGGCVGLALIMAVVSGCPVWTLIISRRPRTCPYEEIRPGSRSLPCRVRLSTMAGSMADPRAMGRAATSIDRRPWAWTRICRVQNTASPNARAVPTRLSRKSRRRRVRDPAADEGLSFLLKMEKSTMPPACQDLGRPMGLHGRCGRMCLSVYLLLVELEEEDEAPSVR